jgi:putative copper export protein
VTVAGPALDATAVLVAVTHWLALIATTLWTGALALSLLVLGPAARFRADGPQGLTPALAVAARGRATRLARYGLLGTLLASLIELAAQAYAAGGITGLVSGQAVSALLESWYGCCWIAGVGLVCLTLLVLRDPDAHNGVDACDVAQRQRSLSPPGILYVALEPVVRTLANASQRAGLLGMAYLLVVALSGHAPTVPHLEVTSVALDWLHLLAMAVWIGSMAAMAFTLMPVARMLIARSESGRSELAAVLDMLDRFSLAAYLAVFAAAFTGMFNSQVHLSSLADLFGTLYGRLLLAKLAAIGMIMALSASHVYFTRPRLRALPGQGIHAAALAGVTTLARRIRVEVALGAVVLLCVALMEQVEPSGTAIAPQSTVPAVVHAPVTATAAPVHHITATRNMGTLTVTLTIGPAAVGPARFTVRVLERGSMVANGQVRIKLSVPGDQALGAAFIETSWSGPGYMGRGDLVQTGRWRADVLVRTPSDPLDFRDVPFEFTVGPDAAFLAPAAAHTPVGPANVRLKQVAGGPASLAVHLPAGLQVRYAVAMAGMGTVYYPASPLAHGWYNATIVFPMAGMVDVAVQVRHGGWQQACLLRYRVDATGSALAVAWLQRSGQSAPGVAPPPLRLQEADMAPWKWQQ